MPEMNIKQLKKVKGFTHTTSLYLTIKTVIRAILKLSLKMDYSSNVDILWPVPQDQIMSFTRFYIAYTAMNHLDITLT